jgi:hypothetical protein
MLMMWVFSCYQWKKLSEELAKSLQKFWTIWPYQMLFVWLGNAGLAVSLTWCHDEWQHPTNILNRLCWRAWKALSKYRTVGKASKMSGNCCSYMLVGVQFYQCILLTVKRCGELNLTVLCFSKTYVQKECIFSSRMGIPFLYINLRLVWQGRQCHLFPGRQLFLVSLHRRFNYMFFHDNIFHSDVWIQCF